MMGRANLGQLLGNVGETIPAAPATAKPAKAVGEDGLTRAATTASDLRPPSRDTSAVAKQPAKESIGSPETPAYLRYVRKETRLREDQQNQLTLEARRLNRAKKTQGPRITENSLIRVAVDLFLAEVGRAVGDDEGEIRKSMTP